MLGTNLSFCVANAKYVTLILYIHRRFPNAVSTFLSGEDVFSFTALLHTYLAVSDVTKATVSGLKGLQYIDKVHVLD